jgi:hypothetical protein
MVCCVLSNPAHPKRQCCRPKTCNHPLKSRNKKLGRTTPSKTPTNCRKAREKHLAKHTVEKKSELKRNQKNRIREIREKKQRKPP